MKIKSDKEIVRGILQNNNKEAFKELIEKYECLVINTCFKILRNKEDAEDVAQEVFLKAFQCLCELRNSQNLSFWLYRISLNKSINYQQKKLNSKSSFQIESVGADLKPLTEDTSENPFFCLEQKEKRRIIDEAIRKLPARQQEVFFMSKYENKSYNEISQILNISFSAVESLLFRAKANLRKHLLHYYNPNKKHK